MKHNGFFKRLTAVALALILTVSCGCVLAEESTSSSPAAESQTVAELLNVPDFKFFVRDKGIGKGEFPVYTAPSEDSIRLSDGKLMVNVGYELAVAGFDSGWLMVRFEVKDKKARVGYIPQKYVRGLTTGVGQLKFVSIPVVLAEETEITDNPRSNSTPFGTLTKGTQVTILGKYTYTGNWWYVETELAGQRTRGFINRTNADLLIDGKVYTGNEALGFPVAAPDGSTQIGTITVNGDGDYAMIVRKHANADSAMVARAFGGDVFPCYGSKTGPRDRVWYYIWVDGVWGWFSSGNSTLTENE